MAIIQLVKYLLSIPREDLVIAYHERYYTRWINAVQRIKKWDLIWEVEEIYCLVKKAKEDADKEINGLRKIKNCHYILATELLKDLFGDDAIVCNGVYDPLAERKENRFDDGRIHVIYGGTLNKSKGGAAAAAAAAEFLDEKYHVHICGFGSEEQVAEIKQIIEKVDEKAKAKVSFEGLLSGKDYSDFLQKCDIGLSTQNPDAAYNQTSFPSKILEYMRNGVKVVSVRIPAVETAKCSKYITFYDEQSPQAIAEAIKEAADKTMDSRNALTHMHIEFKHDLEELIRKINDGN